MLGRAWNDDKVLALQRYLKMPLAHVVGHLEAFWHSAYDNVSRTGRLNERQQASVETWAMWEGAKGRFVAGLIRSGLLKRKNNYVLIPKFAKNVPEYVRKRWLRKGLRNNSKGENVRTSPDLSGPTRQDKTGVEQTRQGQTRVELSGVDKTGVEQPLGEAPEPEPPARFPDSAPDAAPPDGEADQVVGVKGQVASDRQLVCSVLLERLRKALAQTPPAPVLFLLLAAGINPATAKSLCARFDHARIRLAAHYACRQTTSNVAGLLRSAIEHETWDLT